ncbi:MAG: prepilin-type N-terminal cleavage/methylation domain-containing protein [Pseudomonadota bacterium]
MNDKYICAKQSGFTLLEVLISMTLLIIIVFELAAYQLGSLMNNKAQQQQLVALQQLENLSHAAWVGQQNFSAWQQLNTNLLPKAQGQLNNGQAILSWQSSHPVWHCSGVSPTERSCFTLVLSL